MASLVAKAGACFDEEVHHNDNNGAPSDAEAAIICKTMITRGHDQQVLQHNTKGRVVLKSAGEGKYIYLAEFCATAR